MYLFGHTYIKTQKYSMKFSFKNCYFTLFQKSSSKNIAFGIHRCLFSCNTFACKEIKKKFHVRT